MGSPIRGMRIAVFGPPGAGKGTQARLLAERRGYRHISTGDLLRQAIQAGTEIGEKAVGFVDAGRLVPDALVRALADEAIAAAGYDDFILDGYPRTVQQAEWLTAFLEAHGEPLDAVLFFRLRDEVVVDRLSKRRVHKVTGENYHTEHRPPPPDVDPDLIMQRPDDLPEAIRRRLQVYHDETHPVEAYYRKRGKLTDVDAQGSFDDVFERIVAVLEQRSASSRQKT